MARGQSPVGRPLSLRAEARQRGVTVYQVRLERGVARGVSRSVAVGHAKRTGETPLSALGRALRGQTIKPPPLPNRVHMIIQDDGQWRGHGHVKGRPVELPPSPPDEARKWLDDLIDEGVEYDFEVHS